MLSYNFPHESSTKKDRSSDKKDYFREESLCITEENRYENVINPIKLADLGWSDDYKLDKLMQQQIQQIEAGKFDPEAYFGGIMMEELEGAFMTFEVARKEFDFALVKRKSTGGVNKTFTDDFKYQTGDFNKQALILSGCELNLDGLTSSSDDEGDDEAEKFVQ